MTEEKSKKYVHRSFI